MVSRALIGDELGALENFTVRPHDPGPPKEGEMRIAVRAAAVSFADVLNAKGLYQVRKPTPFIPGSECAGVVEALGPGVTGFAPGDRVMVTTYGGALAESANARAQTAQPIPDGMDFATAAAFAVSNTTSWHALVDRGQLQAGETLVVLGAAGAVGLAAVQIGKHLGARVIASASTPEKRDLALAMGADAAIEARADNWRDQLKAANDGKPVDVVFDPVGGEATEQAFRSLAINGRHLVVGFTAGITKLPTNLPLLKGASLIGVNLWSLTEAPEKAAANSAAIHELGKQGKLHPHIAERYPLDRAVEAMEKVASGQSAGRIIVEMAGPEGT